MRFSTSLALVAATIVPVALAQSVTIDPVTLTQCATSTINFEGSSGPYYVALLPGSDPCTEDALAEYYDVSGNSVDYLANLPAGTQVQVYVLDVNGSETWGAIETIGDGDASCLPGASTSSSSDSATSTSTTDSAAPSSYVPPQAAATTSRASTYTPYNSGSDNTDNTDNTSNTSNTNDTPANAADDTTGGASTLTASVSLLVGAVVAAAALL